MILFKKTGDLVTYLDQKKQAGSKISFVPTMGALHAGHISLIEEAKKVAGPTVCSIFVNPTQFNDPKDFEKYPSTLENDILLLEKNGTDILFLPFVQEIYPNGSKKLEHYDLGYLETILEGRFRPGHFQGVCQVMSRLLKIVQPDHLFMGQKDYQQCMVIKRLIKLINASIIFHTCPTMREADGLAMSSRNLRLNETERKNAAGIYQALTSLQKNIHKKNFETSLEEAKEILLKNNFRIDYIELADEDSLEIKKSVEASASLVALIAAFQNEVRLIDNMILSAEHN